MKTFENILFFAMGFFLFSISMIVLQVGRMLYGVDASIIWGMGVVCFMSLQGIVNIFTNLRKQKEREE